MVGKTRQNGSFSAGSHAPALIVIHKCLEAHHFGRDAEIQRPWMAIYGLALCLNQALVQPASYRPWHWIPASMTGMTTFPVWLDLCITTSAPAWERSIPSGFAEKPESLIFAHLDSSTGTRIIDFCRKA
jgi:hypothetical protein